MSLRRGVSTLSAALTITGAGAAPAAAHFFTTNYQRYVAPSLVQHQNLEAGIRQHKHATGGSRGQAASGVGKRDGLPTGGS
ncbi:MAG TPA: hypothetical protein VGI50_11410 [Solirubrobacteraceae bacterium]|jgi:hypothetical protein